MSVKIQINNLEALERLIGGDTELEIEVRNSVVQSFAEKHLKAIANSETIQRAVDNVRDKHYKTINSIKDSLEKEAKNQLAQAVGTFKTSWTGAIMDIKLNPSIKEEIENTVNRLVSSRIHSAILAHFKKLDMEKTIEERVEKAMEYHTDQLIKSKIRERLEKVKETL